MPQLVAVWITRPQGEETEVVVSRLTGAVLTSPLTSDEHPCETAWRTARAATGYDAFISFRKLPVGASAWHLFQVAPEDDLSLPPELCWRPLSTVAEHIPAWTQAVKALASTVSPSVGP